MNPNMWRFELLQVFSNPVSLHSDGLGEEGEIFNIEISLKLF